jgi:hypothetical protein
MPEIRGDQLDVSAEEQRYLRRTFRRFALPYVLMGFAFGAATAALPLWIEARPHAAEPSAEPRQLEEIAALRGEIAALSERTLGAESALAKLRERLAALESRGGEPADTGRLEEQIAGLGSRMARLEGELDGLRAAPAAAAPASPASQLLQ